MTILAYTSFSIKGEDEVDGEVDGEVDCEGSDKRKPWTKDSF